MEMADGSLVADFWPGMESRKIPVSAVAFASEFLLLPEDVLGCHLILRPERSCAAKADRAEKGGREMELQAAHAQRVKRPPSGSVTRNNHVPKTNGFTCSL